MGTIFFELALTFYFAASLLSFADLLRKRDDLDRAILFCSTLGFALHTVYLFFRYIKSGQAPVFSMHEANSYFAWCIMLISSIIRFSYGAKIFHFSTILAFLFSFIGAFFPRAVPIPRPELRSPWIDLHALLAVLGVAIFSLAFITSILYILQERAMKMKRFDGIVKIIPNLEMLDRINYRLILLGFPLFTFSIIVGLIKYYKILGFLLDPKEIWSAIVWFVYLVVFYLRVKEDWRKRRAAYLTIVGFLLLVIGFFGVNLFTDSFHRPL